MRSIRTWSKQQRMAGKLIAICAVLAVAIWGILPRVISMRLNHWVTTLLIALPVISALYAIDYLLPDEIKQSDAAAPVDTLQRCDDCGEEILNEGEVACPMCGGRLAAPNRN